MRLTVGMRFVIATSDYAGLGFATRMQDEGHEVILAANPRPADLNDPERMKAFARVGCGMVRKEALRDVMEHRSRMRDWYWIWDFNHSVEENETLRRENFKVLGGGRFAESMEHDRERCLEFTTKYGLQPPPSHAFNDPREAMAFLKQHQRTAFVYKPDTGANFETFLPESEDAAEANEELRAHLSTVEPGKGFILQERKDGVETNVEVWFHDGEPVFAFMGLECKKRYAGDLGDLMGCAFDYAFVIPLGSKAVSDSVGKLYPAYHDMRYTGFGDANFIAARDGIWFFEKCERFGYNAHPNLLFNLSRRGVGETLANLIDGDFKADFSGGFGASVTMSTRAAARGGQAVQFPEKLWPDIFWWDVYKENDLLRTAGYDADGNVLIVTAYGYTIQTAWETLMKKTAQIKFPYRSYRIDGADTNYPSSPLRRYQALTAMGYLP